MVYFISAGLLLVSAGIYCWWIFLPHREIPMQSKRRILCIGDSITFGAGVIPARWRDSYPAILQRLLGDKYQVLNYGISGATMQYRSDQPYKESFIAGAEKANSDICILMLGTNDSKPHNWNRNAFQKDLEQRVVRIRSFPSAPKMILAIPPAAFGKPIAFEIDDDVIRDQIRPMLIQFCREKQIPLIDLYRETKLHPEWFADGVHPNKAGNQKIAELVHHKLNEIFAEGESKYGD